LQRVNRETHRSYRFHGSEDDVPAVLKGRLKPGESHLSLTTSQERHLIHDAHGRTTVRQPTRHAAWVSGIGQVPVTREEYLRLRDTSQLKE
jgi:hypothetical protein